MEWNIFSEPRKIIIVSCKNAVGQNIARLYEIVMCRIAKRNLYSYSRFKEWRMEHTVVKVMYTMV